jgi:hypothetical protein
LSNPLALLYSLGCCIRLGLWGETMATAKLDRRVVRRRVVVAATALTAASVFALMAGRAEGLPPPSPNAGTATCSAVDLGTLGGNQGNATAVSSNGLVTGYAEDSSGTPQPVFWKSGRASRIATGLINVSPTGINSRGEVVGVGVRPSDLEEVGWHWVGGRTTFLQTPAGKVAVPAAISDSGRIAGALASNDDGGAEPTTKEAPEQAVTWASANSPARVLPALSGDVGAHVYGLNQKGVMVGNSQGSDHFTPAIWDAGGHVTALAGLGGDWGIARAVDDTGVAVGAAVGPTGEQQAMEWDVSHHGKKHGYAGGRAVRANGLVHGHAVGQTEVREAGDIVRTKAVEWDDAGNASIIPPLSGHPGAGVNAATPDGVVVGFSSDSRGARRPTSWTCAS